MRESLSSTGSNLVFGRFFWEGEGRSVARSSGEFKVSFQSGNFCTTGSRVHTRLGDEIHE